jgi:hypothetical protein
MQFMTKLNLAVDIHISYKANIINNTSSTNFFRRTLDGTLSRKTYRTTTKFQTQLSMPPN